MVFMQKEIYLHGGKKYYLLTPELKSKELCVSCFNRDYTILISNNKDYSLLADVFTVASCLEENEVIYLPIDFDNKEEIEEYFGNSKDYFEGIVIFNYCATQIDRKKINLLLKSGYGTENKIEKTVTYADNGAKLWADEYWKITNRLTIKNNDKILTIAGNRDVFNTFAYTCLEYSKLVGRVENYNYPHTHYDYYENTSKSTGITFYYW